MDIVKKYSICRFGTSFLSEAELLSRQETMAFHVLNQLSVDASFKYFEIIGNTDVGNL